MQWYCRVHVFSKADQGLYNASDARGQPRIYDARGGEPVASNQGSCSFERHCVDAVHSRGGDGGFPNISANAHFTFSQCMSYLASSPPLPVASITRRFFILNGLQRLHGLCTIFRIRTPIVVAQVTIR